jgi:hypothetical protein
MVDHVTAATRLRRAAQIEPVSLQALQPDASQTPNDSQEETPLGMVQISASAQVTWPADDQESAAVRK